MKCMKLKRGVPVIFSSFNDGNCGSAVRKGSSLPGSGLVGYPSSRKVISIAVILSLISALVSGAGLRGDFSS